MPLPVKRPGVKAALIGWLSTLRLPVLFVMTAAVFGLDLVVQDMIPFVDEVVLALATAILGSWKKGRTGSGPAEKPPPDPARLT